MAQNFDEPLTKFHHGFPSLNILLHIIYKIFWSYYCLVSRLLSTVLTIAGSVLPLRNNKDSVLEVTTENKIFGTKTLGTVHIEYSSRYVFFQEDIPELIWYAVAEIGTL